MVWLERIRDRETAIKGLDIIIDQGEGSKPMGPTAVQQQSYPHFFKFEEIVCGRRILDLGDGSYSYSGAKIPYDQKGVWPMRPNPKKDNILHHSNCYTESRAFHKVYRLLLRKLQEMFDTGDGGVVNVAVQLMEALEGHGKKLMWTKFKPVDSNVTCGPIWDYDWPESN
jgi:hypothetical protein